MLKGQIELDLVPQGTFSERIRAGGAGIPAFFTPTGVGTLVAEKKETREFDGRPYLMERALKADFALVKAWKGDKWGNLVYRKTARNFNPMMATAATVTIAEVEHLVEVGELEPDLIHTPSVFVKRIFQGELFEKRIERRTVRKWLVSSASGQWSVASGQKNLWEGGNVSGHAFRRAGTCAEPAPLGAEAVAAPEGALTL